MGMPRTLRVMLAGVLVATLTVGCGGSPNGSANGMSKTELTVGMLPIIDTATFFLAKQQGYFKDEGLTVKEQTISSTASAIQKTQTGSLDITVGEYATYFRAVDKGLPVRILAENYVAEPGVLTVMSMPDSGIRSAADLAGKKVAVQSLKNIQTVLVRSVLRTQGVSSESVEFVQVPLPEMPTALKNGSADAVAAVEPFITVMEKEFGAHQVADLSTGATAGWPIQGYFCSEEFVQKYPQAAAAFRRAVQRAARELTKSRATLENLLPTYTKIKPRTAALVTVGTYPSTTDVTRLQRVANLMYEFDQIEKKPKVKELVPKLQ